VIPLLLGAAAGAAGAIAWDLTPYSHANTLGTWGVQATRYTTILTTGVNLRARIGGRLYSVDLWREHDHR